jgi:hypothetical protein
VVSCRVRAKGRPGRKVCGYTPSRPWIGRQHANLCVVPTLLPLNPNDVIRIDCVIWSGQNKAWLQVALEPQIRGSVLSVYMMLL